MNVNVSPVKFTMKEGKKQSVSTNFQAHSDQKSILREMQEKEYPFLDSDVSDIFDELLELKFIELPEMKRPDEAEKANDPNYCKYRLVIHHLEKWFVFKDRVMRWKDNLSKSSARCGTPYKRHGEGFDPNAYKLFAKAGYNPNEPSMLGKLPSVDKTRQAREGLGYNQPPPVRISIRRASNNHITFEDDVTAPNINPSVFYRLGESTARTSVFERLGLLKKRNNKHRRSYLKVTTLASSIIQKDFKSLIPSRMRRRMELMVSCKEKLKAKAHTVVYTKEREEDEESVGSSYHVNPEYARFFASNKD
uniref:Uncharacterized protein n=1 Tax=Solanum tuberosum TaxID=4113 RepID=M1DUT0_SOLTU